MAEACTSHAASSKKLDVEGTARYSARDQHEKTRVKCASRILADGHRTKRASLSESSRQLRGCFFFPKQTAEFSGVSFDRVRGFSQLA